MLRPPHLLPCQGKQKRTADVEAPGKSPVAKQGAFPGAVFVFSHLVLLASPRPMLKRCVLPPSGRPTHLVRSYGFAACPVNSNYAFMNPGCRGGEAAVHSGPLITGRFQGEEFVDQPAHDATGDSPGRGERSSAPLFSLTLLSAQFSAESCCVLGEPSRRCKDKDSKHIKSFKCSIFVVTKTV